MKIGEIRPFCFSRAEDLGETRAASRALARIGVIRMAVEESEPRGILARFAHDSKGTFEPRSELNMRLELQDLQKKISSPGFLAKEWVKSVGKRWRPA